MSQHTCRCPATPAITEPSSQPVRCGCCGEPLVITCAKACNPEHHAIAARPVVSAPGRLTYARKACGYCHQEFTPTGGRSRICPDCRSKGVELKDLPAVTP